MKKITTGSFPELAPPKAAAKLPNLSKPPALSSLPTFTGASPRTPEEHMARRKSAGLTNQDVGDEFGVSKSTAHRKTTAMAGTGTKAVMRRPRVGRKGLDDDA